MYDWLLLVNIKNPIINIWWLLLDAWATIAKDGVLILDDGGL